VIQRELLTTVGEVNSEMFRTPACQGLSGRYGTLNFAASRCSINTRLRRAGFVPLALIHTNRAKRLIGSCSRGAKYL